MNLPVLGFNTVDIGYRNQLLGAINAINKHCKLDNYLKKSYSDNFYYCI